MEKRAMVQLNGLATGYAGKRGMMLVSSEIDATIYSGELTCLLGTNGAGKSTLLRTLSAFQPSLAGSIRIGGKALADYSDKELARQVGVVLTERCEVDNLTVQEIVGLGRTPYTGFWGNLQKEDKQVVADALEQVGIEGAANRMIQALSDGERQKVMIAKVLAQQTPVIFLDEPTAFLDFPSKVEIMRLLCALAHDRGKTVFLSTHDLELALQLADRLWLMDRGKGIVTGTPEDLSLDGTLEHFFCRQGIAFDKRSGLFHITTEYRRSICLTGEGCRYDMVKKALRRHAVYADKEVDSIDYIDVGTSDTGRIVWHPATGNAVAFDTIGQFLRFFTSLSEV